MDNSEYDTFVYVLILRLLLDNMVLVENGYFKWTKSCRATLRSINLRISGNMLITVIGQVGSGKSSLLSAIMGEMIAERGTTVAQVRIPSFCDKFRCNK